MFQPIIFVGASRLTNQILKNFGKRKSAVVIVEVKSERR